MKLVALTLLTAFALASSAVARDEYCDDDVYGYQPQPEQSDVLGWNDNRNPPKKIYNWPDQRYYGQHGMMLD